MRRASSLRFQIVAGVLTAALAFGATARAQDAEPSPSDIKAAARAFDNAREAYGSEDYETAADQFETADGHAPSPVAVQWAIDSHHKAGHAARAATLAALAKQRYPEVAELVELADRVIAETEPKLLEVQVVCEEPCELLVDNKIVHGRPASTRTLYLDPGQYSIKASFGEGRKSKAEEVSGQANDTRSVLFQPPILGATGNGDEAPPEGMDDPFADDFKSTEQPGEEQASQAEASSGWSPTIFWVGASLTAVSGVVTLWSGLDTQNNPGADTVREECRGQGETCPEYQDGLKRQNRTNILLGVTGGLAVFTVVAAVMTDWSGGAPPTEQGFALRHPRKKTAFEVEPWLSVGQGATIGATGRF